MSDRSPDNTIRHPADERTADQSTQSASGLGGVRSGPGPELNEDVLNRNEEGRYETPRQYESGERAGETDKRP
jgi:hypothetical protein